MNGRGKVIPFPKSPRPARADADTLVEVRRCRDQGEALVVRALLESEGIPVIFRGNLVQSVHPFSVGEQASVAVMVAAAHGNRARAVLAAGRRPRSARPPRQR